MAEYRWVDWDGLRYYHEQVTQLIDDRLRSSMRFGGEFEFKDLPSPDSDDVNTIVRVLDSFTVVPDDNKFDWFDDSVKNRTLPAGTLLHSFSPADGYVVYKLFIEPTMSGSGSEAVDLSNYYTIEQVDAKIIDALVPYATKEYVEGKLSAIRSLIDVQTDNIGRLTARVTSVEETLETRIGPAVEQLEETATNLAETKADVKDIPSLEGYATEEFVATAIKAIEIPEGADLSDYAKTVEVDAKIANVTSEIEAVNGKLATKADKSDLEGVASEAYVDGKIAEIEIPSKVSDLDNDAGYLTQHQDLSDYAKVEHKHSITDITDYVEPDLSEYAKKEDIPEVDLSNFYNKTEVENIVNEAVGNISVPEVPTNVGAFVNDAGYITEEDLPDLSEYAKVTDIPDVSAFATEDFVKQKIAEAQLSDGEVDLSAFYTKEEIEAKGFATEEYVQQQLDDADVVGMDTRITQIETQAITTSTRLNEIEDQSDANAAAITALDGEIDQVNATLLTMDTQITTISQNLADLQAYGTF